MSGNKIIIRRDGVKTRTALTDEKGLAELIDGDGSIVGNIYAGVVKNILPNRFAFIDIGERRNGFLFLDDAKETHLFDEGRPTVRRGQTIAVQVVRDETGGKGAYLTSRLTFPGWLCVLSAPDGAVSVSRKITDEDERRRLAGAAREALPPGCGVIVRTACAGRDAAELAAEIAELAVRRDETLRGLESRKPPFSLFSRGHIERALRELFRRGDDVVVNCRAAFDEAERALKSFGGGEERRVSLYSGVPDIFDYYGVSRAAAKLSDKRVKLGRGGFIVIERTEACYVVDVNSGGFSGSRDHEHSALELNTEACREIARQMRLRGMSGIIIVDFVGMKDSRNRAALLDAFAAELADDRSGARIAGMTNLGLVEVTRKRARRDMTPDP